MEWNWLLSLIYGFVVGFTEFLPLSADAHQILFLELTGTGDEYLGFRLFCQLSVLLALLLSCKPQLDKLARERKIASVPAKRRKRQPDTKILLDIRVLKTAVIPLLVSFLLYSQAGQLGNQLWLLAVLLLVNGILLYIPQFLPSGNKNSQSMSALDALLMGVGGALAVVPGISRIGALISVNRIRGGDGQYAIDMSLLLCIPALIILIGFDIYGIFTAAGVLSLRLFLQYILAAAAAFAGAYLGIILMRFLAVKVGYSSFAYYSWGAALFTFILYLSI